jgi:hypothetical protein
MALWRGERPRAEALGRAASDVRTEYEIRLERQADRFRSTTLIAGSEHPGAVWPAPPARSASGVAAQAPEAARPPELATSHVNVGEEVSA